MYRISKSNYIIWGVALAVGLFGASLLTSTARAKDAAGQMELPQYPGDALFANINGEEVDFATFNLHVKIKMRSDLYHGGSEERLLQLQRDVADELIERTLLLQEAERRKITADADYIDGQLKKIERAYQGTETWEKAQKELPHLREKLLGDLQLEAFEEEVREVADPTDNQLQDYYNENIDKFTEPEKFGLSVILIRVDPSSGNEVWEAAREQTDDLYKILSIGADFAEFARELSDHETAREDGTLPFIHLSQLSLPAQEVVKDLKPGDVSNPAKVMEGYVIFRLNEKQPPVVHPLEQVKENAAGLYRADTAEKQFEDLIEALRNRAKIEMGEQASDLVTS